MVTGKKNLFIEEYLVDFNATQAAIRAGYSKNQGSAKVTAHRLLSNPKIKEQINNRRIELEKKVLVSKFQIINELIKYAFRGREGAYSDVTPKEAMSALIKLGDHAGIFKTKDEAENEWEQILRNALTKLNR